MTEHLQPGPHLSPDQLSAFAENVLPEHERLASLTHLAGCPSCRQVVFLAQQADHAIAAASPVAETPRRGWFSLPQIFGAATAALVCSLILALIVHQHHDQNLSAPPVTTAKAGPQPPPAAPSPVSPAKLSAAGTHTHSASITLSEPPPIPAPKPPQVQMVPAPKTLGRIGTGMSSGYYDESKHKDAASYEAYSAPSGSTYTALPPKAPVAVAGAMPKPPAASPAPESRMRQADTGSAKPEKVFSAAETVTVAAAAPGLDTTTEVAADTIGMNSVQNLPLSGRAVAKLAPAKPAAPPVQLPSNKPAASVLHASGRSLALDTAGNLFLSLDLGKHWIAVTPKWSGNAVQISLAPTPARLYLEQPAQNQTQNQSNNSINGNVSNNGLAQQQASIPAAGFQLTTATGAVWISSDGLTWHAR